MVPLGGQVSSDPDPGTWEGEPPNSQDDENDVRKQGSDVDDLPRGLDSLEQTNGYQEPGTEQGPNCLDPRISLLEMLYIGKHVDNLKK